MTAPRWFIDCEREHDPDKPRRVVEEDWQSYQGWCAGKTQEYEAQHRRIGWAYGYGAGYVDASRGKPCVNKPPTEGRERGSLIAPSPGEPPRPTPSPR